MTKGAKGFALIWIAYLQVSQAAWNDDPRYGSQYTIGFQMLDDFSRINQCAPCDERRSNSIDEYRGNGADNLGYDWSPKAWGGIAFPNKPKDESRSQNDWPRNRDGRKMPDNWDRKENCRGCVAGWTRPDSNSDRNRPSQWDNRDGWDRDRAWISSSTSKDRTKPTENPIDAESTVTSQVLGVMYRNDKRLPVDWHEDGRSMRWDGFRNGIPWDNPKMDRRSGWDGPDPSDDALRRNLAGDDSRRGHYASGWNYGSPLSSGWGGSGSKWNTDRPWNYQSNDNKRPDDRSYGQTGGSSFGSSYPHPNVPPGNTGYTEDRPQYPSNSWSSSTPYPSNNNYPQSNYYPNKRPSYETSTYRPYQDNRHETTPSQYYPNRPSQGSSYKPEDGAPWNYQQNGNQYTTPQPNQNYLPQNSRPPSRPSYNYAPEKPNRPYGGTPSITIWNTRPNEYESSSGFPESKPPPKGQYTGFITEIHGSNGDSHGSSGDRYPYDRPHQSNNDRYSPSDRFPGGGSYPGDRDRYPSNSYPSYDKNQRPGQDNRYPDRGNGYDRYPSTRPDYDRPSYGGDGYDNRYPSQNSGNRYPNFDSNRYPNYEKDRYPTNDRDRYPNYDSHQGGPGNDNYPNRPGSGYDSHQNRPSNSDDRYPNRPGSNDNNDRYPNRPGINEQDRGPNPGTDSGSWNYGEENKDGPYRRSGGSYPPYKGGHYFTSAYLASASTPSSETQDGSGKKVDETTQSSTQD